MLWKNKVNVNEIFSNLASAFGNKGPTRNTIYRNIRSFRDGKTTFTTAPGAGRPKSAVTERTISLIRQTIANDDRITLRRLAEVTGVCKDTVRKITNEQLHMTKLCAKWVPHKLTADQKKNRVRICQQNLTSFQPNGSKRVTDICTGDESYILYYQRPRKQQNRAWRTNGEPRATILKPGFGAPKAMFTVFLTSQGPVLTDMIPKGRTMTGKYYSEIIVPGIVIGLRKQKPGRALCRQFILHDNASSHKTLAVRNAFAAAGLKVLDHPAYSPDLAICDFWLFALLKKKLAGRNFTTRPELARAVNQELKNIPQTEYRHAFDSWIKRMKLCIDAGGEYFE